MRKMVLFISLLSLHSFSLQAQNNARKIPLSDPAERLLKKILINGISVEDKVEITHILVQHHLGEKSSAEADVSCNGSPPPISLM